MKPPLIVVIVGNLSTGVQTVHGPFPDHVFANEWALKHTRDQYYLIRELQPSSRGN